jgi:hypothetical protein
MQLLYFWAQIYLILAPPKFYVILLAKSGPYLTMVVQDEFRITKSTYRIN